MRKKNWLYRLALIYIVCAFLLVGFPVSLAGADEAEKGKPATLGAGITSLEYSSAKEMLGDMGLAAAQGDFELYFDTASLYFGVRNKKTGAIFLSNPYNAALSDDYVGNMQNNLESQLVLYYTDSGNEPAALWSYADCVKLNQFTVYPMENGVRAELSIGKDMQARILPEVISASSFQEKILDRLTDEFAKSQITYLYTQYTLSDISDAETAEKLKKQYPLINTESIYVLRTDLTDVEKNRLEESLKEAGFTEADLKQEYTKNQYVVKQEVFPNFKLNVEYTLTDEGFRVNIPAKSIVYDTNNFHLTDLKVLEYFGSEMYKADNDGFLLVPDGSGAIVSFADKAQTGRQQIIGKLYGTDCSLTYPETPSQGEIFHLPVFGHKNGRQALFAIVSNGSGLCSLNFGTAAKEGSFYTAYPVFSYTTKEVLAIEAKVSYAYSTQNTTIYDKNVYQGEYTVLYNFLYGDQSSYSSMADVYRSYLYGDRPRKAADSPGFSVETLGTVSYPNTFFGIPYSADARLTTFEQNIQILKDLQQKGIHNINLTLEAWREGGFDAVVANRMDPSSVLGGKNGLKTLSKFCRDNGIDLYPTADFLFVSSDKWLDGFSPNRDATRLMTHKVGGYMKMRPDRFEYDEETFRFAVSPTKYAAYFSRFFKELTKAGMNNVAMTSMGNYLNANYKSSQLCSREETIDKLDALLADYSKNNALGFDGANSYVLPYASYISDLSDSYTDFPAESYSIPFIQLVLNGVVPYSSEPFNEQSNLQKAVLQCISSGASPKFTMIYDNINKLKRTAYTEYHSVNYDQWFDKAVSAYQDIRKALDKVQGQIITSHRTLKEGVTVSTYSNNVKIYVNTTEEAFSADSLDLQPLGYQVVS